MSETTETSRLTLGKSLDSVRTNFENVLGLDALGSEVEDMLVIIRIGGEVRLHMSPDPKGVTSMLVTARGYEEWIAVERLLGSVPIGAKATALFDILGLTHKDLDRMTEIFFVVSQMLQKHGPGPETTNARIDLHEAVRKIKEGLHLLEQSYDWIHLLTTRKQDDDQ